MDWWLAMIGAGCMIGALAAWSQGAARVFLKTLAAPTVLIASRVAVASSPPASNILLLSRDFLLLVLGAFAADYAVGLALGRHTRDGYRRGSVGH